MKVLLIGHYRDGTGWSQATINYILALDAVGIDVVCRAVKLNAVQPNLPDRILELEHKSSQGCDTCIQFVLPHLMDYNGYFKKNIGLFMMETDSIIYTGWPSRLQTMDELWVTSENQVYPVIQAGLNKPKVVPIPADMSMFQQKYEPLEIDVDGKFIFYFIGEFNRRKRVAALLHAFHTEFSTSEPVGLLLKCSSPRWNRDELYQNVADTCRKIKDKLRLYPHIEQYHNEYVMSDYLSDTDLMRLHKKCHCFVMPSFGEAWCIVAFDAMAMGNAVVASNTGGMKDFLQGIGYMVQGTSEPVLGADTIFTDLHTGREQWFNISINSLREQMRNAYENRGRNSERKTHGIKRAYEYSYEKIGQQMKELLNNVND